MSNKWERRKDESAQAYQARKMYQEMGADRNMRDVAQKLNKSLTLMARWAKRFEWVESARAWDDHLIAIDYTAMQKRREKIADDLERMRWELPGHELENAEQLVAVALKLLALPHVKMKGKDGKTIAPANAQEFRAAAELIVKADDMRRRALDLPSLIIKQSLAGLSNEQLAMLGGMIFGNDNEGTNDTGTDGTGDSREDGP